MTVATKFTYEAIDGERVDQLAARFLGSTAYTQDIYDLNPELLDEASLLLVGGTKIKIPDIKITKIAQGKYGVFT